MPYGLYQPYESPKNGLEHRYTSQVAYKNKTPILATTDGGMKKNNLECETNLVWLKS